MYYKYKWECPQHGPVMTHTAFVPLAVAMEHPGPRMCYEQKRFCFACKQPLTLREYKLNDLGGVISD